ncbi:MAG: hypothetical protein R3284_10880, partial [Rubricoccaceae bacterium]|nr:hypothetical protein [Rubricoccaceae bacterium]
MELFDALLPFIIMLIYFLASVRKRTARKRQAEAETTTPSTGREPTDFEKLLRKIQEAAEQTQERAQEMQRLPDSAEDDQPIFELEQSFHGEGGFNHERHGFGAENP